MDVHHFFVCAGVFFFKIVVYIYDVITLPFYAAFDKPWLQWKRKKIIWAKLEDPRNPYSCYIRQVHHDLGLQWKHKVETLDDLFRQSVEYHGSKRCFGTREVLGEEKIPGKSGKLLKKLSLGEYKWLTYEEAEKRVDMISKGLLSIGVKSKKPVVILAETRVEWILTAQACFRINVPVVTLYATLGESGIAHGINETEVTHVITSADLLPKLKKVFPETPKVSHVVYMEGSEPPSEKDVPDRLKLFSYSELEESGRKHSDASYDPPKPEDLAILMYTSGSTGTPKGVMITNKNVIATIIGLNDVIGTTISGTKDMYIGYLPVAHVLELAAECYVSSLGVPVGFSTPQTLTDFSTAIKSGCEGDLRTLKPTLMAAVPLMLDRVRKSILHLAGPEGSFARGMFDFAITYKNYWMHSGFETPLLDRFLMKTYHDFMGGSLRLVMCGGAPISPDTQDFIRCCLNVQVVQGYGMTETAACATLMDRDDYSSGRVGSPLSTCKLRLVDWEDGRYYVTDKPHPRGEIVVGGNCVTLGYFKREEQTKECFKEELGTRWFYTGDIGEVLPNGTLKIIDRKNDLVKLQFGEYVALGKVEAELKTCPLVENICVLGSGLHCYLVALVVPNRQKLQSLAKEIGKGSLSFDDMCLDKEVIATCTKCIREHALKCRLFGAEIPQKVKLCNEEWLPDSGLVTAAFKIRRKMIQQHYQKDVEEMYTKYETNGNAVSSS